MGEIEAVLDLLGHVGQDPNWSVDRRHSSFVKDDIGVPGEVSQGFPPLGAEDPFFVELVEHLGVVESVAGVGEGLAPMFATESQSRDRVQGVPETESGTQNVDFGTQQQGLEIDQLTEFFLVQADQASILANKALPYRGSGVEADSPFFHHFLHGARVVVGVAVGEQNVFHQAGVQVASLHPLGGVNGRIHQQPPAIDPDDEARGPTVDVKPVAGAKHRHSKIRGLEMRTAIMGKARGWKGLEVDFAGFAVFLKAESVTIEGSDHNSVDSHRIVQVAKNGLDEVGQFEALALDDLVPKPLGLEIGESIGVLASGILALKFEGAGAEDGLFEQSKDGSALVRSADESELSPLDIVVVVKGELEFGQRDAVVDVEKLIGKNKEIGNPGVGFQSVFDGLGVSADLQQKIIPADQQAPPGKLLCLKAVF